MPNNEPLIQFLVEVIAFGGSIAAILYLLLQYLGKKWIENKFAQKLNDYKYLQDVELQRLRVEIDSLLSGALKLQEREFELLPEAWEKLDEAYGLTRWSMSPAQISVNVGGMTNDRLEEYLATTDFLETQKVELRSSSDKDKTFQELCFWHRLGKANKALSDIERFIARRGIFFPLELKQNLVAITQILRSAIISHEVGHEEVGSKLQREGWKRITEEVEPLYKSIENEIQLRLRSHGPTVKPR